ncbi:hypothetical protein [Vampirovibrio sp.]|uniref:hypothetical protein n=1 Tax=Vampirovibrio sp. TaxID=2717857 RepID=UPI0035933FF1
MRNGRFFGVNLSEYALLLGLMTLMGIAGLSVLGRSTEGLLGQLVVGNASSTVQNLARFEVNADKPVIGGRSPAAEGHNPKNTTEQTLGLTESFGGGSNVSSAEGHTVQVGSPAINQALEAARLMDRLATQTSNTELKAMYEQAALQAYFLAGSQATFETNGPKHKENTALSEMASLMGLPGMNSGQSQLKQRNALQSISNWSDALASHQEQLLSHPGVPLSDRNQIETLLSEALNVSETQYGNAMQHNDTSGDIAALVPPDADSLAMKRFRSIVSAASKSGAMDNTPVIQSSATAALALDF